MRSRVHDTPAMTFLGGSPAAAKAAYVEAHGGRPEDVVVLEDTDQQLLLSRAIEDTGLSIAAFGRDVVGRDERTVRRWLNGEIEIPQSVHQWLARLESIDVHGDRVAITVRSRARA